MSVANPPTPLYNFNINTFRLRLVRRTGQRGAMNDTQITTTAITFRCPPELEPILPRPLLAVLGLPDWFKAMPQKAFSPVLQNDQMTVKKCPPFIDAMTSGFLMPLVADLKVENGEFSWDREVPHSALNGY